VRDIGWQSFAQVFKKSSTLMGKLTRKPLMIPEIGVVEQGGDEAAWITQTFLEDASVDHEGDWRVETSPGALTAFQQVAHSPLYQGQLR
jgi:hypothetical protein